MSPSPEFLKAVGLFQQARDLFSRIFYQVVTPHLDSIPRIDRGGLQRYQNHFDSRADALANQLGNGDITVREWRNAMQVEIERLETTAYVIGRGGVDQMSREDLDAIRAEVTKQTAYLDNWASELQVQVEGHMGTLLPADVEKVKNRAKLYGGSANTVLARASVIRLGIPELPCYPGDGKTDCHGNCGCGWDYKQLDGNVNWDIFWRRHKDDSCEQCIAREKAFNPLQVREGAIQPYDATGIFSN